MDPKIAKARTDLETFIETSDYEKSTVLIRNLLRSHLLHVLGGDWEKIRLEHGLYTINCRTKSPHRILDKFDRLVADNEVISLSNFYGRMPDLVAGRLVAVDPGNLFKLACVVDEGFDGSGLVRDPSHPHEKRRFRHGKFSGYDPEPFKSRGYKIVVENSGYCSVHFVYKIGPEYFGRFCDHDAFKPIRLLSDRNQIPIDGWHVEIQVRTIMDEAWGEVDHLLRYEDVELRNDPHLLTHSATLAGYLQAANYHVGLICKLAKRGKV